MSSVGYDHIVRPLLASPQFQERHARHLLEILINHEGASMQRLPRRT